ncbi:MAG TPA: ABC transporter permease subunit [Actinomycetota bacterium]
MIDLVRKELRDQRRALIGWGIGLSAMVLMYSSFWPSVRDNADQFESYLENIPDALRSVIGELSLGTPVGYLQSELFSFLGPALILVFAIGAGARSLAGEEEQGTLDLLVVTPITRRMIVLQKFAAMVLTALGLGVMLWISVVVVGRLFGLDVAIPDVAAAILHLLLLGVAFGAIAMFLGASRGRRALAIGVTSALAVGTFILNAFAPTVDGFQWAARLSPFFYYGDTLPLRNGLHIGHAGVLVALAAVAVIATVASFDRRDLLT